MQIENPRTKQVTEFDMNELNDRVRKFDDFMGEPMGTIAGDRVPEPQGSVKGKKPKTVKRWKPAKARP